MSKRPTSKFAELNSCVSALFDFGFDKFFFTNSLVFERRGDVFSFQQKAIMITSHHDVTSMCEFHDKTCKLPTEDFSARYLAIGSGQAELQNNLPARLSAGRSLKILAEGCSQSGDVR